MLERFQAESGALSARVRDAEGQKRLLHSAIDPELEARDLPLPAIWGDVVLCLGTGLGYHLRQLPLGPVVVLCDAFPELAKICMRAMKFPHANIHTLDASDSKAVKALRDTFPAQAKIQVIRHPASYRLNAALLDEVARVWFSSDREKSTPQKPRVLFLYGQHFLQEEVRHALEELGCEFKLFEYGFTNEYGQMESLIARELQEFRPDILLSINMKGLDPEGIVLDYAKRLGVAVHTWFVDDPRPIALSFGSQSFAGIHAWSWERAYLPWLVQKGFASPRWLPLAGDPRLFSSQESGVKVRGLVFTGSAMGDEYLDKIRRSFLWDPRLAPLVEDRSEALLQGLCTPMTSLDNVTLPFVDERNRTWLSCLINHTASHKKRIRFLQPLVNDGVVLAGDSAGWLRGLGPSIKVIKDVDYRRDLAAHYRTCQVNLNLTSLQMPSAVNQRVFDVPLVGGFVLTDAQSDLLELFEPQELATFSSREEFVDLARYYLRHEQARQSIVAQAHARILQRHTYAHRLKDVLAFTSAQAN